MTERTEHLAAVRRRAAIRLGLFGLTLVLIVGLLLSGGLVDVRADDFRDDVRDAIRSTGLFAPVAFVVISGALAAFFVPGPLLATLSGVLFGPLVGVLLSVCGGTFSALLSREIGARVGRDAAEELAGGRLGQLSAWLDRYGLLAVIGFRLAPAMPDAALNYAAGLTRLHRWQVALGTAIGLIPRAVGWALVGAAAGGASTSTGAIGLGIVVATDVAGLIAVLLGARVLGISPRTLWRRLRGTPPNTPPSTIAAMRIAIDGPAGAGKSTVARLVAERLSFLYLDTGAMYRCAALASLRGEDDPGSIDVDFEEGGAVLLAGEDVTLLIRSPDVTAVASKVAAEPSVRAGLVARQQELLSDGRWVAEGRDVGTVVVPDAELKVFLDADPRERAQRRAEQLGADVEEVLRQQNERDARDRSRAASPLVAADDAVLVDTTGLGVEQVVDRIVELARDRGA